MKANEINIRDPFILLDGGKYYLYGTRGKTAYGERPDGLKVGGGFDVFIADELDGDWSGPFEVFNSDEYKLNRGNNWASEVHKYKGAYYMFATFKQENELRGTYILRSDRPDGHFVPHSEGAITPHDWHSLDGTLYISPDGTPYMVFCHEWVQIGFGTIEAVKLSEDLKRPIGEPFTIVDSKKASWITGKDTTMVTDGPYFYRDSSGRLLMIWSSFFRAYVTKVMISDNGDITGPWSEADGFLFDADGGHGMIFRDKSGALTLSLHSPNSGGSERPVFIHIAEDAKKGLIKL